MIGVGTTIFLVNPVNFGGGGGGYIVDTYSAPVAYSVRKISSTASNCLRVRRDSDNAEQDIGFSGNDLDTASLSTFVGANSAFVVKWYNQGTSGSGADLVQATAANQVRIVNAGVNETDNGVICITQHSATGYLQSTNHDLGITTRSSFVVYSMVTNLLNRGIYAVHTGTGNDYDRTDSYTYVQYNNTLAYQHSISGSASGTYRNAIGSGTAALPQTLVTEIVASGTGTVYLDGTSASTESSFTAFTGSTNQLLLFGRFTGGSVNSQGNNKFQELIFFETDESANKAAIETDINGHYSIY